MKIGADDWGHNELKLGFKIGISSTHVYLQVSFSMFYSQCIPSEVLANVEISTDGPTNGSTDRRTE